VFSVPAVAGDLVFIGSCAGTFYALNKTNGEVRWSYDIRRDGKQQSFHGNPLFIDDLILIGTDRSCDPEGVGHVYAFERNTGKVRWKYKSTSVPTDIVKVGSNIFFGSFQDQWSAVDIQSAGLAWRFSTNAPNPNCDPIRSPVADEHHVYIAGLDGVIYALEPTTGRVKWKIKLPASPTTSLLLNAKSLFIGASNNHIYRLKTDTGEIESQIAVQAMPVGRPMFDGNSLILFLENRSERAGYVISLSTDLEKLLWVQKSSPEWASERPREWRGLVLSGNCRGELAAFRTSDGAPQWKLNLKGCIRSIGESGNTLFVGVQEGMVYALGW
jgi:outer membrane protein assembly factor BamB